jgi:thiosulfate reductase cytochrome b subunit
MKKAIYRLIALWLAYMGAGISYALDMGHTVKHYAINDPSVLKKPYTYLISVTKSPIIEFIGILGIIGAIGFVVAHGLGRYMARKKYPVELEYEGKEKIYNLFYRLWHWLHAFLVVMLIITGFYMHWAGPNRTMARLHIYFGETLVVWYIIWIIYLFVAMDIKQFIPTATDIKEGMIKQALFYMKGIFRGEPHPYASTKDNRLNPLQKLAYAGVMFGLVLVIVITGFLMAKPLLFSSFWKSFGIENFYIFLYIHLFVAYLVFAFIIAHIYLATTGDKIVQHFKTMLTGYHDHYKHKH